MNKAAPGPARIVVIAGFALSCFGLLLFLWLAFGGAIPFKPEGYRVQVAFPDAAQLAQQADVRVAGVSVGKVVASELAPSGNRTLATLQIEEEYAPIRRDARAILRQKTLLGETYVEMTTGSRGAPILEEGARLPDGQVAPITEFDELLRIWNEPTRDAFQEWQRSMALATRGRAREFNDALGNLPLFVESAQGVVDTLNRRRQALRNLVRNTGTTFEAITRDEEALQSLIVQNTRAFETLASQRENLAESIRIFPTFLAESRATLRRLGTFSRDTEPLVRELEPVLQDAQPTLRSLQELSPELVGLFRSLDALIPASGDGFPAMARVLRGLDPTLAAAGPFLQQLNPILKMFELFQPDVTDFLNVGPSALNAEAPDPPNSPYTNGHALPQLIVDGQQSFPRPEEDGPDPQNRGNAYLRANALTFDMYKDGFYILPNWRCDIVPGREIKATEDTQGCFIQEKIPFFATSPLRMFPHVEEAKPGGELPPTRDTVTPVD